MGFDTATIERLADCPPVEEDGALPTFLPAEPGTRLHFVGRWGEDNDPGWFWRWVVRFAAWQSGGRVQLSPQSWQIIGLASTEGAAKAASLDETYFTVPLTVDRFLPRESVALKGLRFWRRKLHRLLWHPEPKGVEEYECVPSTEFRALLGSAKDLRRGT